MDSEGSYNNKVNWTDAEDETLITMIEANPALWNNKRRDYRDAVKKQRIWMEISLAFPGSSPSETEKRFTAIKEKLRREKKKEDVSTRSGSGASRSRRWHLLPKLEFLAQTMQPRLTICSDPRPGSSSLDSICENSPNFSPPTTPTSPTMPSFTFTSPPTTDLKCPPRSLKTTQSLRADFFKKGMDVMEKIGDSAANIILPSTSITPVEHLPLTPLRVPEEKKASHFKVLDYIGDECTSMDPDERNKLMRDILEVFWRYKIPK